MKRTIKLVKINLIILAILLCSFSISGDVVVAKSVTYHGNTRSHIFHKPGCRYYNCRKCTAEFSSRDEAIEAGYRPCKICRP
jgi:hypothetical protein